MKSVVLTFSFTLLGAALLLPCRAQAAPGDLDPTYGAMGKTITSFINKSAGALAAARQPDGKTVAVGYAETGSNEATEDFALARYNRDGSLDTTFGTGGRVTTDFAGAQDEAWGVVVQSDGKIVACGQSQKGTETDFALARYNANGTLDKTFGSDHTGKIRTAFLNNPGDSVARAIAVQTDGKLVVAGRLTDSMNRVSFALARYKSDGSLDKTFGFQGQSVDSFSPQHIDQANAIAIQQSGKILVGGATVTNTDQDFEIVRYDSNGDVDSTFGLNGIGVVVTTDFNGNYDSIHGLALAADDSIVAGGDTANISTNTSSMAVARYNADGKPDTSFGTSGKATASFGQNTTAVGYSVVLQPDGGVVVGGYITGAASRDSNDSFALARFLPNGKLDSTFGTKGEVTSQLTGGDDLIRALILQPDGTLLAVGNGGSVIAVGSGGGSNGGFLLAQYDTGLIAIKPLNLSTRADVGTGANVLIGGFIITGTNPERVLLRAIGPSLGSAGIQNPLANPVLELHEPNGTVITNDNWKDTQETEIAATNLAPSSNLESAIVGTFAPGAYTAIVSGKNGGTGVGLVEAYDLEDLSVSQLANVSTRGFIKTGNDVMIGGFIIGGIDDATVLVRGIGPSLMDAGVANPLTDPTLEIHNANGAQIAFDDNWKDTQEAAIQATGLAPKDDREAAILMNLAPGAYTAIVRGKGGLTGVGLVETYNR